ncbi:SDR family NAD(P)-dependent oxidoreductase, partial [Stenotrophomonas maltophilia]
MQLTGFEGRVALVTGASGGIGEALVRLLAEAGCTVVATDREAPRVADTRVKSLALDVTDSAAVDALVDQVES